MTRLLAIAADRVAVDEYGAAGGEPVVLLHGYADSRLVGELVDEAGKRLGSRVICPDRPGIGRSSGRLASILDYPERLAAVADALELDRFGLVGLSGGAPFALPAQSGFPRGCRR